MASSAAPWVYKLKCLDIFRTKGEKEANEYAEFQADRYRQHIGEESQRTAAEFEELAEQIRRGEIP